MGLEIETAYRVDPGKLPDLSDFPYQDIRQVYFTPVDSDPRYPETAKAEWRIREKVDGEGNVRFTTAVKFGDKQSGSRTELETDLAVGAFGTTQEDVEKFAYGLVQKRRYDLGDSFVVDVYEPDVHGELVLAEKEFETAEHQASWQAPDWCEAGDDIPSNRLIAAALKPSYLSRNRREGIQGSQEELVAYLDLLQTMGRATIATVSGMTGSGKSTTARAIAEILHAPLIETDHLHIGARLLQERHGEINHDMPHAYDYAHAGRAALELSMGQSVILPRYSYEAAERTDQTLKLDPTPSRNVVIDGLYAELAKDVLDQAGDINVLRVLVDTPLYVSIVRRILRDTTIQAKDSERIVGFTPEGSLRYVTETAVPTYLANHDPDVFDFVVR